MNGCKEAAVCFPQIRNNGPSVVDGSQVQVNIPSSYGKDNDYLLYILQVEVSSFHLFWCVCVCVCTCVRECIAIHLYIMFVCVRMYHTQVWRHAQMHALTSLLLSFHGHVVIFKTPFFIK